MQLLNVSELPNFDVKVLDDAELALVAGGIMMNDELSDGCSCTTSQCHMDGVTDGD